MGPHEFGGPLWLLVVANAAIFIAFATSFVRPRTRRDWHAMGAQSFIVALFAEVYGFPLTLYELSGWLGPRVPGLDPTHAAGHLLNDLIDCEETRTSARSTSRGYLVLGAGIVLLSRAWRVLWEARREQRLATSGPYAAVRHLQYLAQQLIMVGLLQWPTLPTLAMFPILAIAYVRLAAAEDRELRAEFGAAYDAYAAATPQFLPHLRRRRSS